MAISARDDEIGAVLLCDENDLIGCGGLALGSHFPVSLDLVALKVTHHVPDAPARCLEVRLVSHLDHVNAVRCAKEW